MTTRGNHARRMSRAVVGVLAAILVHGSMPDPGRAADPPEAEAAARELARQHGGVPDDYRLVHERTASVVQSGESIWVGKLVGPDGEVHTVSREPNGRIGGGEVVAERARQAVAGLTPLVAKADDALRSRIAATRPGETVPASVWMTADVTGVTERVRAAHPEVEWIGERPLPQSLDEARAIRAELYEARADAYAAAEAELATQVIELGGSIGYASPIAPIAFVDLPASAVDELAALPIVESLGLERTWVPVMTSAGPTVDANWTSGSGDQGGGIRVAVVEYHNVRNSGDLGGRVVASHSSSGTLKYATGATFDHPTWVAGAIAGGGTYRGVAPGARIVSASTGGGGAGLARDRAVIATTDWAVSPSGGDADVVNVSLVQDTTTGSEEARRYFDSVVDQDLRVVVAASGNHSALGTWRVGSPGTGWNVLTVGGTDDRNTSGRGDDRLWFASDGASYVDPPGTAWNPHGDFNKPNLSAPAVSVRTANGLGGTGTSVATPIVSGIAAQILARAPTLMSWPEAARAVLMAGAVYRTRMPNGSINADHEGVGSASALWSNRILNAGDGSRGGYRVGTASGTFSMPIQVLGGQRVRVVVAWNSRTGGTGNLTKTDALASDLDLRVRLPNGATYGSFTFDNSYEMVDIVSPTPGTATIEVVGARIGSGGERYGLAWAKIGGDGTPPRVVARAPEPGEPWAASESRLTVTFSEPVTGLTPANVTVRSTAGGPQIPAALSYWAAGRRLTVTPDDPLPPGEYRLGLSSAIRDVATNSLGARSWTFRVVDSVDAWQRVPPASKVVFASGAHTGYRFDSAGRVTASRTLTLGSGSSASADRRAVITHRPGRWLHIVNGAWAGYWVRESTRARIGGDVESLGLASTTRLTFTKGTYTGYHFASNGTVLGRRTFTLYRTSGANTNRRAIINGAWHHYVTNGVWAGYWVPESGGSYVAGARDHHDLGSNLVRFVAGSHTGRTFSAPGAVVGTRVASIPTNSSGPGMAWAIVNGVPRYLIGAGVWSGTWVAESSRVRSP
ncbi:MAG TPA: S8 family serine peptidase [Candidatus Limnocylindria bacterium]|nr:S8 family serine peptidase [Candidatus Limnocylindria bacterium]